MGGDSWGVRAVVEPRRTRQNSIVYLSRFLFRMRVFGVWRRRKNTKLARTKSTRRIVSHITHTNIGMAALAGGGGGGAVRSTTPGRRKKTENANQYFDVGKVGRKTGITLQDTGIRDQHGLEPVSGIFSSPESENERGNSQTLTTSEGMDVDVDDDGDLPLTLSRRRKISMPPPRQTTPRHTNIGSPKRMSSARPTANRSAGGGGGEAEADRSSPPSETHAPANRKLDFAGANRHRKSVNTVDAQSPFKPRKVLRRSDGPARRSIYDQVGEEGDEDNGNVNIEQSIEDIGPIPVEEDYEIYDIPQVDEEDQPPVSAKRKPGRPRKSDQSDAIMAQQSPQFAETVSAGEKRGRASWDETENSISHSQAADPSSSRSKKIRTSTAGSVTVHRDNDDDVTPAPIDQDPTEVDAQLHSQLQEGPEPPPPVKGRGRPKGKGKKAAPPKERDANRAMQKRQSPVKMNDSPSKRYRGGSAGPVSNVQLRATTPFDDSNQTTSRAGRNLIQPLKFWQNESLIWKGGEIEGVIRADPVETSRAKAKRRKKSKTSQRLKSIEEESDTESILPDEWEAEMGVITGNIAAWNPLTKSADPGDPIQEGVLTYRFHRETC